MTAALTAGVSTSTITRLLEPLIRELGTNEVADRAHVSHRTLGRWRTGEIRYVPFETADRIIVDVLGEPALWQTDAELAAAYQEDE